MVYIVPMARPTKADQVISDSIGGALSPTQVRRLTDAGLGVPAGADPLAYWRTVAPMVGRGRHPYDVIAVELGAKGYATALLRRVIAEPDESRSGVVMAALERVVVEGARSVVEIGTNAQAAGMPETPDEETAVIVDAMKADYADALSSDADVPTFEDAGSISAAIAVNLRGPAELDRPLYNDEFAAYAEKMAKRLSARAEWAASAPDAELISSVQISTQAWGATVAAKIGLGEEDAWRIIGALAPAAGVLVELMADVQSQIGARSNT